MASSLKAAKTSKQPKVSALTQEVRKTTGGALALDRTEYGSGDAALEPKIQTTGVQSPSRPRAFELLFSQPTTLIGLSKSERDRIVVSAVADDKGNEYPVSHFRDQVWDLTSEVEAKNRKPSSTRICWPGDLPKALVDDAKAVLYCALRRGRDDGKKWSGSVVLTVGKGAVLVLKHFASLNINNFGSVRALHLSDYIADLRKDRRPNLIYNRLLVVDLLWLFSSEIFHPLPEYPWSGSTLSEVCGCNGDDNGPTGRTGKTPVIPLSVQRKVFTLCEARLKAADTLFRGRDREDITVYSAELTRVRDAVLYLLQVTSGMRNSETVGIRSDCWRTEVKNGVVFHWVRTIEIKTHKGLVDYLVPPEAIFALEILKRYAEPLQARLADEGRWLEKVLGQGIDGDGRVGSGMSVAEAVERLNHIREIGQHLFLGIYKRKSDHLGTGSRIDVMSGQSCNGQLKRLASAAGTDWDLTNHQCRRTFAFNIANSRLGRMALIFLKWQLKHSSVSWTQLYASNPYQDQSLYREMEAELVEARVGLMEGWMRSDALLSGGAGKKLMQNRATPIQSLQDLLRHTADHINIRSTGHAWCLSGTLGCHGQGVYDPTMCSGCSQAIIDEGQSAAWQMIHLDNLRLAAITDCGPAATQKAERAIKRSVQVLDDLGVAVPTQELAHDYAEAKTV